MRRIRKQRVWSSINWTTQSLLDQRTWKTKSIQTKDRRGKRSKVKTSRAVTKKETNGRRTVKDAWGFIGQSDQDLAWDGKTWTNEKEAWREIDDELAVDWQFSSKTEERKPATEREGRRRCYSTRLHSDAWQTGARLSWRVQKKRAATKGEPSKNGWECN